MNVLLVGLNGCVPVPVTKTENSVGYDEAGLYVLDPWFSDRDHISYDAYECLRVGGGGMVVVGSTDSSHIAEFKN